jgi:hypothetical protein
MAPVHGDPTTASTLGADHMTTSLPVVTLVVLGALIAVLGLFAAGSIEVAAVGLVAVAVAGVLDVAGRRAA